MSDDRRHGFSIIALIGSVFSPYYAWSGRGDPENHVALNVALYGKGSNRWTMTERGRSSLSRSSANLKIGPSSLAWSENTLTINVCELSAPIPRRVLGKIRLTPGAMSRKSHQLDLQGRHFWQPIAPSARVEVDFASPAINWNGNAYLDANWGSEPLEDGFRNWDWSRAPVTDGTGIFYDATLRDGTERRLALHYDKTGNAREVECPDRTQLDPGAIWKVTRSTPSADHCNVKTLTMLEDTPFYTRSRIRTSFHGEETTAIHESLDLNRFSKSWVQCLLPFRMPRALRQST